jgi:HK97 family phage portal protein
MPNAFPSDEKRREFREAWQRQQTGRNRHKTAILEFGMKYHELGLKNEDIQFIETRKFSVSEIARLFRIPPHMIGDLDKATFSNIEQQSLEFVIHTLRPWLVRWEESIRYHFLAEDDGLNVEFPVTAPTLDCSQQTLLTVLEQVQDPLYVFNAQAGFLCDCLLVVPEISQAFDAGK